MVVGGFCYRYWEAFHFSPVLSLLYEGNLCCPCTFLIDEKTAMFYLLTRYAGVAQKLWGKTQQGGPTLGGWVFLKCNGFCWELRIWMRSGKRGGLGRSRGWWMPWEFSRDDALGPNMMTMAFLLDGCEMVRKVICSLRMEFLRRAWMLLPSPWFLRKDGYRISRTLVH